MVSFANWFIENSFVPTVDLPTVVDDAIRLEKNSRDRRNDDETAQESKNDTELTNKIF
jgi:hypothetical protein